MKELSHFDDAGNIKMVDVSGKESTSRRAVASCRVLLAGETLTVLRSQRNPKGDPLEIARIAGFLASKKTSELIPLCHQIALSSVEIRFEPDPDGERMHVEARARAQDRTGVEMEALCAVSVAALTLYDMLKAIDRGMSIESIQLELKTGGKSGPWTR